VTLRSEIGESPAVVERLLVSAPPALRDLADRVRRRRIQAVFIAARGTSDHAATYAQYALGVRNELPVGLATPSVQSLYGASPNVKHSLVVGISQSGRSPDVVEVLADARRQDALTLAVTNAPDSPLAGVADVVVDLNAGPELAVAASKTYVAELVVMALLSEALRGAEVDETLLRIPSWLADALDTEPAIASLAADRRELPECAVIARGYNYPTAREWALKLKEIARIQTDPYSAADFEHGPITLVEPGYEVLAIAVRGPTLAGLRELLARLARDGAKLLVASDDPEARRTADGAIALDPDVPEWLTPIVTIVHCQLFAYHLALARGLDPDAPRHLQKVTLTR
jgi:glucosamine--fructose-6-phosphate aminotransferase (isomerizing)